ncbi:hypothetical protein L1F30_10945 [Simiduia sp. 21SJ11W-1]|uniref:hypothetical protein n=1 Tax=Simiduia sp. 21SJ11W-1 TaxID=2909669 RepID=UPI00209FEC27|nr:hypothetical protein [Simiduia sp. 21SJ11W-1]UTA46678.1 hypothetical protein L1F30_10945 [Simiduia sp. 21SJ11W-1]
MLKQVFLIACCFTSPWLLADSAPPKVLASISERGFLFDVSLSEPGVIGVVHVRYQVDVHGAWHSELAPGAAIDVVTPGSCELLMRPGERYLLALVPAAADAQAAGVTWATDCDSPTEAKAQAQIEALNREQQMQASAF